MSGEVEGVEAVLAAHEVKVGPITGAWTCACGATSTNGHIRTNDLTTATERRTEFQRHVDAILTAREDALRRSAVEQAVDEWLAIGPPGTAPPIPTHWLRTYATETYPSSEGVDQ